MEKHYLVWFLENIIFPFFDKIQCDHEVSVCKPL